MIQKIFEDNRKVLAIVFLVCISLSFLLYSNSMQGEFVYDDSFFAERQELHNPGHLTKIWIESYVPENDIVSVYRPLTVFTFALNFIFFGSSTTSFHTVNIILNGLVVFFVFIVVWRLFDNFYLALFSSLVFAFLPIHTSAVSFIKSRDELLSALFILVAWFYFLAGTKDKRYNRLLLFCSSIFYLLALFSKEQAVIAPALFLALYWIKERVSFKTVFKLGLYFVPAALFYVLMRWITLGPSTFTQVLLFYTINPLQGEPYWRVFWTAFKIAFRNISNILIPLRLSATYGYNHLTIVSNPLSSWETLAGIVSLGGFLYLSISKRTRVLVLGIGSTIFLILYFLVSKFVFTKGGEMIEEHWMYFPSLGISIIVGFLFYKFFVYNKKAALVLFGLLLLFYGNQTIARNRVWQSEENLFRSMIEDAPNSTEGHYNLAVVYYNRRDITNVKLEVNEAAKIYQKNPDTLSLLGRIAYVEGQYLKAAEYFEESLYIWPYKDKIYRLYAFTLVKLGEWEEILNLKYYLLRYYPNDEKIQFLIGLSHYKLNDYRQAQKYFDLTNFSKLDQKQLNAILDSY